MPTYFGFDATGSNTDNASGANWVKGNTKELGLFTCPNSGSQDVVALELKCKLPSGSCNLRMAIYAQDGTLIAQSTDAKAIAGTAYSWQGFNASELTWANGYTNLTGGVWYRLYFYFSSGDAKSHAISGKTSGDYNYNNTDYSAGMPSPLGSMPFNSSYWEPVRCGVDPAAGGLSIPVAVNGAWKAATPKILVDGAWKAVAAAKILVNGAWKAHP